MRALFLNVFVISFCLYWAMNYSFSILRKKDKLKENKTIFIISINFRVNQILRRF